MLTPLAPADYDAILPLAECKRHLRLDDAADDALVADQREAAIGWVEDHTQIALSRRQFRLEGKQFVPGWRLPRTPAVSVEAISYFDAQGADLNLATSAWYLGGGILEPAHGTRWPFASGRAGAVRVTFTAGYENPADIPRVLKQAALVMLTGFYEDREGGEVFAVAERSAIALCRRHKRRVL